MKVIVNFFFLFTNVCKGSTDIGTHIYSWVNPTSPRLSSSSGWGVWSLWAYAQYVQWPRGELGAVLHRVVPCHVQHCLVPAPSGSELWPWQRGLPEMLPALPSTTERAGPGCLLTWPTDQGASTTAWVLQSSLLLWASLDTRHSLGYFVHGSHTYSHCIRSSKGASRDGAPCLIIEKQGQTLHRCGRGESTACPRSLSSQDFTGMVGL